MMATRSQQWAAALIGAATAMTGMLVAAPAKADVNCPNGFVAPSVSSDCYFLYMMARDRIAGSQDDLIKAGHTVCGYMANDTGPDPVIDAAKTMVANGTAFSSVGAAGLFANLAAVAYCPAVISKSG